MQNITEYGLGITAAALTMYGTTSLMQGENSSESVDRIRDRVDKIINQMKQNPEFDEMDFLDPLDDIDMKANDAGVKLGVVCILASAAAFALTVKAASILLSNK